METDCRSVASLLPLAAGGEASEAEANEVFRHVETCAACGRAHEDFKSLVGILRALPRPALPPELAAPDAAWRIAPRRSRPLLLFPRLAAAGILAAALAGAWLLLKSSPQGPPGASPVARPIPPATSSPVVRPEGPEAPPVERPAETPKRIEVAAPASPPVPEDAAPEDPLVATAISAQAASEQAHGSHPAIAVGARAQAGATPTGTFHAAAATAAPTEAAVSREKAWDVLRRHRARILGIAGVKSVMVGGDEGNARILVFAAGPADGEKVRKRIGRQIENVPVTVHAAP